MVNLQRVPPGARPLRAASERDLRQALEAALAQRGATQAAHCIHELWMRQTPLFDVDQALERLWRSAGGRVPPWLPMRYVDWLPRAYEVAARFRPQERGRNHVYLVLLDYSDRRDGPHGVYVGMTAHRPQHRFDQHKAGIRASGSVLRRGLELLEGPTMHLQRLARQEAERIEADLAAALAGAGLIVQGGH
jgi:hypothetical protein